jgi:hypothetical protein
MNKVWKSGLEENENSAVEGFPSRDDRALQTLGAACLAVTTTRRC